MHCPKCGSQIVGAGAFCSKCGAAAQVTVSPETPDPTPLVEKPARSAYIWLSIDVLLFTLLLAVAIFNFTWMAWTSRLEEAEKSVSSLVAVVIGLGIGGSRVWNSILKRERETDPIFRQKHKKFTQVATFCVAILLAASLALGIKVGIVRIEADARQKQFDSLLNTMKTTGPKNAAFRKNLAEIRSVQASTFTEYYIQSLKLELLLNDYEPQLRENIAFQKSFSEFITNDSRLRDRPKLNSTVDFLRQIDETDVQAMAAWRAEIAKAKELNTLPNSQKANFYNREIKPILAREDGIGKAEKAIMIDARQKGVQLPSDMSDSLQNK